MSNDICLNVGRSSNALNSGGEILVSSPPPYSTEYENYDFANTNPAHLQWSPEHQQSNEDSGQLASLQLKVITSITDPWQSTPFDCSCVLENRFLLLGYKEGVQLIDLDNSQLKPQIIIWTRVRQIRVIETCRIILMLTDRHKQIRCYSYDAILKLIYGVLSLDWSTRRDKAHDVPSLKDWQQVATKSALNTLPEEEEDVPISSINSFSLSLKERLARKQKEKMPVNKQSCFLVDQPALSKPYYVCDNLILQEFYYKLSDSKESIDIQIYQTSSYLFAAVLHRDKIVLWQKKRDHPLRHFYKFKVFWIPTEAKSIAFADDRTTLRHIIVVFTTEATSIELRDSKVQSVAIDSTLRRVYEATWIKEQFEHHLVQPRQFNPNSNSISLSESYNLPYPSLPASVSIPPIQWTLMQQLPFYPDDLPPTTLTTDYSIPPSYTTVITALPTSAPPDPVALPSAAAPQLFFATFSKQSFIIDITGNLYSTQVYRWTEAPNHIEFIQLDMNINRWYAVGFGPTTVEVLGMKTGKLIQKVMHGASVKFLGRWNETVIEEDKKTRVRFKSLVWSCAAKERSHVYMLWNQ
ncbi:hypothetical protein RMCBS344292_06040 [Rhizopus microsporus]|nr:hypothetical protein RMCBS344292_06040 [Rhizopus microsporus]